MNITLEQLIGEDACEPAIDWFLAEGTTDIVKLYEAAKRDNHLQWANWCIVRIMTCKQFVKYSVFMAELVARDYESHYPGDMRQAATALAGRMLEANMERDYKVSRGYTVNARRRARRALEGIWYAAYDVRWTAHKAATLAVAYLLEAVLEATKIRADRDEFIYTADDAADMIDRLSYAYDSNVIILAALDYGLKLLQEGDNGNT